MIATGERGVRAGAGFDGVLFATTLALTAIGAVMVYSASAVTAEAKQLGQFHFLVRQLVAAGLGGGLLAAALHFGTRAVERFAYPILALTVLALVAVLVPGIGHEAGGARRWIALGFFSFQPAEAAKVALVLYLARSLARKSRDQLRTFSIGFLPHAIVAGALMALCLAERDFGSCVVLAAVLYVVLFAAGVRLRHLGGAVLCALPVAIWAVAGTAYRRTRIEAWLDPFGHREGAGFQMVESLLGIGNGGWLGQGLGQGKGKLFYLPAAHTDFIGAVIAEEAGLVGMALLVGLFAVYVWRGLRAARHAPDAFSCWAALGVTTLVGVQALLNLGVVLVLLPTKGLTLPFVSYGGSSLITLLGATGVLLAVSCGRGGFLRDPEHAARPPDGRNVADVDVAPPPADPALEGSP
jgi:cell division protein FtsW